jgi:hypothetical protein
MSTYAPYSGMGSFYAGDYYRNPVPYTSSDVGEPVPGWGTTVRVAGPARVGVGAAPPPGSTYKGCHGGETTADDDDVCCPPLSWNNWTYQQIMGQQSWQFFNEQRVRHALWLLLGDDGKRKGVAAFALANDGSVPKSLLIALQNVRLSFSAKFPFGRWVRSAGDAVEGECYYYAVWVAPVTGIHLTVATPQALAAIKGIPGSRNTLNVGTMPVVEELLAVVGGVVVAKPPLQALIDAFGQGLLKYGGRGGLKLVKFVAPPVQQERNERRGGPQQEQDPGGPPAADSKAGPPWAMIGLGVLVLGAVAYSMKVR